MTENQDLKSNIIAEKLNVQQTPSQCSSKSYQTDLLSPSVAVGNLSKEGWLFKYGKSGKRP
eukprot:UN01942